MKVIITGASGMVGKAALLECIDDERVDSILCIGRSSAGVSHPKVRELIHADFSDFTPVSDQLSGYDACFLCMGISAAGLKEEEYTRITFDYTIALAKLLVELNPGMSCVYVSGQGTDSSEKGRIMWARVKGRTENTLLGLGFRQAYMFRPGTIVPLRGIKSRTKLYQFMYDYFMWLISLQKLLAPNSVINTTQLGRAMINVSYKGFPLKVLSPKAIAEASELR